MSQGMLFGPPKSTVRLAEQAQAHREVAASLPSHLRMGTSSWSFPGWNGLVWDREYTEATLARDGLDAYGQHPLFRAVGVDRTFYRPVGVDVFRDWARRVPPEFRFLVKAHDVLTTARFPRHARFGQRAGQPSQQLLDVAYATDHVVGPAMEGLGDKLGTLLFQFPPQDPRLLGETPRAFAVRLYRFLRDLPRGPQYSVEIRNAELFSPDYAACLREVGAVHCYSGQAGMPSIGDQVRLVPPTGPVVIRWLLRPGLSYAEAKARYAPFTRVTEPDPVARRDIEELVRAAGERGAQALVIVNNKAEGSSPGSIAALARRLAR